MRDTGGPGISSTCITRFIADVVMTSTRQELGDAAPSFDRMKELVSSAFAATFSLETFAMSRADLEALLPALQPTA